MIPSWIVFLIGGFIRYCTSKTHLLSRFSKKIPGCECKNFGTEKKSLTTKTIVKNNDAPGASQLWYGQYIKRGPSLFAVVFFRKLPHPSHIELQRLPQFPLSKPFIFLWSRLF
jgi:hypothetical protein